MATDSRVRNYATIVYQESAPDKWLDIIDELHIPIFVSPLHDKDINKDGEYKKPHWHVLLMFAGKKAESSVRTIVESFGGVGLEKIHDLKAYARYLCHLDDDDKAQYSPDDVKAFGGADYEKYKVKDREKDSVMGEIVDFILENEGITFPYIVTYSRYNKPEWFKVLISSGAAYFIKEFVMEIKNLRDLRDREAFTVFVRDRDGLNELFGKENKENDNTAD